MEIREPLDEITPDCLKKKAHERPPTARHPEARLRAVELERTRTYERAQRWCKAHMPNPADTAVPPDA